MIKQQAGIKGLQDGFAAAGDGLDRRRLKSTDIPKRGIAMRRHMQAHFLQRNTQTYTHKDGKSYADTFRNNPCNKSHARTHTHTHTHV